RLQQPQRQSSQLPAGVARNAFRDGIAVRADVPAGPLHGRGDRAPFDAAGRAYLSERPRLAEISAADGDLSAGMGGGIAQLPPLSRRIGVLTTAARHRHSVDQLWRLVGALARRPRRTAFAAVNTAGASGRKLPIKPPSCHLPWID